MPAWLLWDRMTRHAEKKKKDYESDHQRWVVEQLNLTRGVTFSLMANQEIPPEPPPRGQKKQKPPERGKIMKVRRQMMAFAEKHQEGLASPWHFEEYMGLPHFFEKPPEDAMPSKHKPRSKEFLAKEKEQVDAMKSRMIGRLEGIIEKHGNVSFDEMTSNDAPTE